MLWQLRVPAVAVLAAAPCLHASVPAFKSSVLVFPADCLLLLWEAKVQRRARGLHLHTHLCLQLCLAFLLCLQVGDILPFQLTLRHFPSLQRCRRLWELPGGLKGPIWLGWLVAVSP